MQKSPVSYNGYRRLEDNCNTSAAAQKIGLKATLCFFFLILFVTCFLLAFIYLFIFGCVGSSLLRGVFPQLRRAGATLLCGARASHCGGFSLRSTGSRRTGFSSCGTQAQLLRSMWDLPRPGLKPVSPALAGRFLTTVPPGKSLKATLFLISNEYSIDYLPSLVTVTVFSPDN